MDEHLVLKAAKAKISVIEQDPLEKGLRHLLNFGHTIGHALEHASNLTLPHGQAVAIGCHIESYLSLRLGLLPKASFQKIEELYNSLPLQKLPKNYSRDALLKALLSDKKKKAGAIRFVLIDALGQALPCKGAYCQEVNADILEEALCYMEKIYE